MGGSDGERLGQDADERHGPDPGERDDRGHPGIRPREVAARVTSMRRLAEAEAQERFDRAEKGQGDEAVERQLPQSFEQRIHAPRVTAECYDCVTLAGAAATRGLRRLRAQSRCAPISS